MSGFVLTVSDHDDLTNDIHLPTCREIEPFDGLLVEVATLEEAIAAGLEEVEENAPEIADLVRWRVHGCCR